MIFSEQNHVVYSLLMAGTANSSTERFTRNIDMSHYNHCTFIVLAGAGTGAGTIYVESVPTATGSSSAGTLITGWNYQALSASATENSTGGGDTLGTLTAGTTAGFAVATASTYYMYVVDVEAAALSTATACRLDILMDSTGWAFSGVAIVSEPRYAQATGISVLSDYTTL